MPTVVDFAYTGAEQSVAVPAGVESAVLEVWGSRGGSWPGDPDRGGPGAYVVGTISGLIPGEILYVYVGGTSATQNGPRTFNGGGAGGAGSTRSGLPGGGATDIRRGGNTLAHRIIIGAGGGGEGCTNFNAGAAGGYPNGQNATGGGGKGATQLAGGAGGGIGTSAGQAGTLGQGGDAIDGSVNAGGGGGGGLYGGGGASRASAGADRPGGGGSSYYDPALTDVTAEAVGTWMAVGKARITWADPNTFADANLGPLTATAEVSVVAGRRRRPRRHYIWVRGLDGEQIGVIR